MRIKGKLARVRDNLVSDCCGYTLYGYTLYVIYYYAKLVYISLSKFLNYLNSIQQDFSMCKLLSAYKQFETYTPFNPPRNGLRLIGLL